jgi:DNA gyrase subunit A
MNLERPDLTGVAPELIAYIEALEMELMRYQEDSASYREDSRPARATRSSAADAAVAEEAALEVVSEPVTPLNVVTISRSGIAKRTPRHFYGRQRRSGMGVFDLETPEADPPALLLVADENEGLLLFTSLGRVFRLSMSELPQSPVRARGESFTNQLPYPLQANERIAAVLPENGGAYACLVSERGWVRRIRAAYLGKSMIEGTTFHDPQEGGPLAAACWTPGDGELFLATRQGLAIRFNENQVPARGVRGMRVVPEDRVVAVTAVYAHSGVFLLGHDGKGSIRLMPGFSANKAPGAGGKVALKTERLVGAAKVEENDDIFAISRLGKIIRFTAAEVPAKEGVVQGVHCMTLRADETVALAVTPNRKGVNGPRLDDGLTVA